MAWYDKLLAFAAPASYRAVEAVNNDNALKNDLAQFQADPTHRVDPTKYDNPEFAIAAQGHLDALTGKQQARDAAPTANALAQFSAQGFGSDPSFNQGEWTQGMMDLGGIKPPANNPVAAKAITDFMTQGGAERDALLAAQGDKSAQARIASRSKDPSVGFKDVSMGVENYDKMQTGADSKTQQANAAKDVAELDTGTYGDATTGPSMAVRRAILERSKKYTDPGALALLEKFAKDVDAQWTNQEYGRTTRTLGTGNATKKIVEITDPLGKFVKTEEVANHPRAAAGGGDTSGSMVDVSWIGADGTPQGSRIPQSELPALKSSLETKGITEISTMNRKGQSKTETLIKPAKGKGSILGPRPGSAPAAKPTGGYTYVNGKMVPN